MNQVPVAVAAPAPVAVPASKSRASRTWQLCEVLVFIIGIGHLMLWPAMESAVKQTALSAACGTWVITLYVLARCQEKK